MVETATQQVRSSAQKARGAAAEMGVSTAEQRNAALAAMAQALTAHEAEILAANERDVQAAHIKGIDEGLVDRLMLDHARLQACAAALLELRDWPDVLGEVLDEHDIAGGIHMRQIRVPLGVVGMIYEARPNVTVDSAGIAVKTGNAILLRGGSLAQQSNEALIACLREAVVSAGLPADAICGVDASTHETSTALMEARGLIDVLIPRGGADLIRTVVEHSTVPVIETGTGNCHIYVERTADLEMACAIVVNAKCQRPSVCNAAESLLVDRSIASEAIPLITRALHGGGVILACDDESYALAAEALGSTTGLEHATDEDYATEYLALKMSIKLVEDYKEAVAHINRYGTHHSEAIITKDEAAARYFTECVDAAAVYVNASTRFTDGGEFGLGAEIGISTQKLHARGPMGLRALTSFKFVLCGTGQIRD